MPDSISLGDNTLVDTTLLTRHSRVTYSDLLAPAHAQNGRLATLDHTLARDVVTGEKAALVVI